MQPEAPPVVEAVWYIYMVEQASGKLYTGITLDVARRFAEHQANNQRSAKALRGKGPLKLVFSQPAGNHRQALQLEYQVKKLPRYKKLALITGKTCISSLHIKEHSSKST
ncbi:GIY-YIG nuclease family protein [Marinospirillum alkaliphilum]|uniref:Putative endonuclease n=1 Tax=Marinospirillum alkaliphilum DSM 21637 TaxID=1122209 RepID=A0A1K1YE43_9GAMM|nr:GIY-YIG nuclease family protein [Marinospirillum alkaliphilum]SFX60112.1 putative endonuclease [Marinospirillum alkaliphilum DSM 21637]